LSGFCPGGHLTAILGASGAGKTSLLNILAKRISNGKNVELKGEITANRNTYSSELFATFASYVMQNDILFETLTPKEALQFVANLKYKEPAEKISRVQDTLSKLKLEQC
jgi:ABC-type multidrug transport system ATPase subunit